MRRHKAGHSAHRTRCVGVPSPILHAQVLNVCVLTQHNIIDSAMSHCRQDAQRSIGTWFNQILASILHIAGILMLFNKGPQVEWPIYSCHRSTQPPRPEKYACLKSPGSIQGNTSNTLRSAFGNDRVVPPSVVFPTFR